jgi:hypothetical protein
MRSIISRMINIESMALEKKAYAWINFLAIVSMPVNQNKNVFIKFFLFQTRFRHSL